MNITMERHNRAIRVLVRTGRVHKIQSLTLFDLGGEERCWEPTGESTRMSCPTGQQHRLHSRWIVYPAKNAQVPVLKMKELLPLDRGGLKASVGFG